MPDKRKRLTRKEYHLDAITLAKRLLGRRLVRLLNGERLAGIIVETEAYVGTCDEASHAFGGHRSKRNDSMYQEGGHAYVYFTYGMHEMFNVVCGRVDEPVAVLIRALQPTEGVEMMHRLRSAKPRKTPLRERDLCSGPGKLCQALAINRGLDKADLVKDRRIWIEEGYGPSAEKEIAVSSRIGVEKCGEWGKMPLRFLKKGNPHVSVSPRPWKDIPPDFAEIVCKGSKNPSVSR